MKLWIGKLKPPVAELVDGVLASGVDGEVTCAGSPTMTEAVLLEESSLIVVKPATDSEKVGVTVTSTTERNLRFRVSSLKVLHVDFGRSCSLVEVRVFVE